MSCVLPVEAGLFWWLRRKISACFRPCEYVGLCILPVEADMRTWGAALLGEFMTGCQGLTSSLQAAVCVNSVPAVLTVVTSKSSLTPCSALLVTMPACMRLAPSSTAVLRKPCYPGPFSI